LIYIYLNARMRAREHRNELRKLALFAFHATL